MKRPKPGDPNMAVQRLSAEPASLQKYSDQVRERIARKAYELYDQGGRQHGRELED